MRLVTTTDVLRDIVPYEGHVTGAEEIKAKVVAYGDLHVLFVIGLRAH